MSETLVPRFGLAQKRALRDGTTHSPIGREYWISREAEEAPFREVNKALLKPWSLKQLIRWSCEPAAVDEHEPDAQRRRIAPAEGDDYVESRRQLYLIEKATKEAAGTVAAFADNISTMIAESTPYIEDIVAGRPDLHKIDLTTCPQRTPIFLVTQTPTI